MAWPQKVSGKRLSVEAVTLMALSRAELANLKARVSLSAVIGRDVRLSPGKGDRFGLCPFHDEKTGSFTVNDRKGFFHCFGCSAHGDVLDWFQRFHNLPFAEAVEKVRVEAASPLPRATTPPAGRDAEDRETLQRQASARGIWRASSPIAGTLAENYLRQARGISIALPNCLRFDNGSRSRGVPALVAAVIDLAGDVVAIQRTFLKPDGAGKADVPVPKRALGPVGRGAVRLAPAAPVLGVAEGIETGLSAMELFRLPVWCALGSNLARLTLPDQTRNVVIFADRGEAGEAAAEKARAALHGQRRKVAVRFPKVGDDFNDELKERRRG